MTSRTEFVPGEKRKKLHSSETNSSSRRVSFSFLGKKETSFCNNTKNGNTSTALSSVVYFCLRTNTVKMIERTAEGITAKEQRFLDSFFFLSFCFQVYKMRAVAGAGAV